MYAYRPLGAFRLVLAMLVVIQHYGTTVAPPALIAVLLPLEVGSVAVLIFFVLSGFVIAEAVAKSYATKPRAFLTNRLLRILPVYALCTTVAVLVHYLLFIAGLPIIGVSPTTPAPEIMFSAKNILANFIAVLPPLNDVIEADYNFLPVIWALRTEMLFYICVFLCLLISEGARRVCSGRQRPRDVYPIVLTVGYGVGMAVALASVAGWAPPIFGFFPYFASGYALYLYYSAVAGTTPFLVAALAMVLVHFNSLAPLHPVYGYVRDQEMQLALLAALMLAVAALAALRMRASRIDRGLGDLTYPLYLVHRIPLTVLLAWPSLYGWIGLAAGCAASLMAAAVLTRLLDPLIGRLRERVRGGPLYRVDRVAAIAAGQVGEPLSGAPSD